MTAVLQRTVPAQRHTADTPWTLVEQAQAGDMDAWAQIWQANRTRIYEFIRWRVGNHALAEDLTSDVFTRGLARVGSVDWQGRDIGAWLVTIARNLIADHFKSGRVRREVIHDDLARADEASPDASANAAEHNELTAILAAALDLVGGEQAQALRLRYLNGLSIEDTARVMGKNENAIKALCYRATRAMLRIPAVAALRGDP